MRLGETTRPRSLSLRKAKSVYEKLASTPVMIGESALGSVHRGMVTLPIPSIMSSRTRLIPAGTGVAGQPNLAPLAAVGPGR